MDKTYFKYKEHPGDFFRNTNIVELPNPQDNLQDFLVQFLKSYQSDERIAHIDDLHKFLDNDFFHEEDRNNFMKIISNKTEQEIHNKIKNIEAQLKKEAYENFYSLVQSKQIEIIYNGED